MSLHKATVTWQRETADFRYEHYNRAHQWCFENGLKIAASAAPEFLGTPDRLDPEEAYVASISSCHMLTFLAICARQRVVIDQYEDQAVGYLEENGSGKLAITRVELSPRIRFAGPSPAAEHLQQLHEQSHAECFIANSVTTKILVRQPAE